MCDIMIIIKKTMRIKMDIKRIDSYEDERFRKKVLKQHGAFEVDDLLYNAIQLSIISVVFCHREPLFFMPKNFKNITKNS